jgi:hypothetical protein
MDSLYGDVGKQVLLYEGYLEHLQEAGTTSDFPTYLEDKLRRRFLNAFNEIEPMWRSYTYVQNVPDFREMTSVGLGELPDLLPVPEDGEYTDAKLAEYTGPKIQLATFGRSFSIGRRLIINDMLNQINNIPTRFGRAARRTLAKRLAAVLSGNATAYDGTALFHASHNNLSTNVALTEGNLPTLINKVRLQTDQNGLRIDLRPTILLIPLELEFIAERILMGSYIPNAGADTTAAYGHTEYHAMRGKLRHVVEPYFSDANDWYVLTEPNQEQAMVTVGFLNGKSEPDIMLQDPGMRLQMGGNDPYTFHFDRIQYKIRYDFAVAPGEWRGGAKSSVA